MPAEADDGADPSPAMPGEPGADPSLTMPGEADADPSTSMPAEADDGASSATAMRTEIDPERVPQAIVDLYRVKEGEALAVLMHLGGRLGLWTALRDTAPCTSDELAAAAGLQERWLREWLHALAAAELIQHDRGRFALTPEAEALLADPDHPSYMPGVFGLPVSAGEIERTIEGFRTGLGMTWEEHGEDACHVQASMNAAKYRAYLVPEVVAALDGAAERLSRGGTIIDVGCGAGVAAGVLAAGFPAADVIGIDPSAQAIGRARADADRSGLGNISYQQGTFDDLDRLPDADLLVTLDVLHDLPRPDRAVAAARRNLSAEGWWLVADIKSRGGLEANRKIPVLAYMYSTSLLYCLSSSLSEPGGAGLGALGLHPDRLEQMTAGAGFGRFARHDFDFDPVNWYYEIRH